MRHRTTVFLGLVLALSGWASAQQTYNLPQVANGVFAGGSIRTTFVLFNNSDQQSLVTIMLLDDAGAAFPVTIPGLGTDNVFAVTLAPGQTRFLETDGGGDAQAGSAQVLASSPVGVAAIFTIRGPAGEFLTESGIGVSEDLTEFAVAVDATGNFNTGLAMRNLESSAVTATLTLFDAQGVQQGDPVEVQLPANGHVAQFVSGELFDLPPNFRGKLTVEATGRLAALTLRQNASPLSFTTLPVVAADSSQTEFLLPQVANGGGTIRTTFVVFNLSSAESANVTVRLTDDDGGPFNVNLSNGQQGSQFNLQVPPCGVLFLDTDSLGPVTAGAARIASDVPVGLAGIFTLLDESGQFLTETGVGASREIAAATVPVDLTGNFNTGIALFNDHSEAATVNLTFYGAGGAAAVRTLQIEPLGSSGLVQLPALNHLAGFVPDLIPGAGGTGSMAIESTLPVAALTLRQNSSPLTFTTLPVAEGVFGGGGGGSGSRALPAVRTGLAITGDRVLDQTLAGGFELSGTVTPPGIANPVVGVTAIRSGGGTFTGVVDPLTRRYRVFLPADEYRVRFGYTLLPVFPAPAGMGFFGSVVTAIHDFTNVVVEGDTTRNFTIPELSRHTVSGRVSGLDNLPPEFRSSALLVFSPEDTSTAGFAGLDGEGDYQIELAPGAYSVGVLISNADPIEAAVLAPQGALALQQVSSLFVGDLAVSGDNGAADFTVPAVVNLSGTIAQPETPQIPESAGVAARDITFEPGPVSPFFLGTGFSFGGAAADGSYETTLVRDRTYEVTASLPLLVDAGTTELGVLTIPVPFSGEGETFGADTVRDFSFPALPQRVTLSGRVMGPEGPLAGVSVTVSSSSVTGTPNLLFTASTFTDSQGNFSFTLFSGTGYEVFFDPDPGLIGSLGAGSGQ